MSNVLIEDGINKESLSKLDKIFQSTGTFGNPFAGLLTQHQQTKYYKGEFGLIVS